MRRLTEYDWHTGKLSKPLRLLVVSDLHDTAYADILPMLTGVDALLIAGDIADRYFQKYSRGIAFLNEASKRVPMFFGVGNHELRLSNREEFFAAVRATGATLLFNSFARLGELCVGCWYRPEQFDMPDMLDEFACQPGCKVLLCHRPEDYANRLQDADVDLVLAGHAHGGQIRIAGQGVYAPGQGLFPKYTHGVYGRMIVSAGAGNSVHVPRWGNPCEVLLIRLD